LPHLILHIGCPKAGSTSIQLGLNASRHRLAKRGILYPQSCCQNSAHHPLGYAIQGHTWNSSKSPPILDAVFRNLADEISKSKCDTVVISSELFSQFDLSNHENLVTLRLEKFFRIFKTIKIVCIVRHQVPYFESQYKFKLLWQNPVEVAGFNEYAHRLLPSPQYDFLNIERYFRSFSHNLHFQFLGFFDAIRSGNLVQFVFERFGIADAYRGEMRANESCSRLAALALLKRNQKKSFTDLDRLLFIKWIQRIHPDQRQSLYEPALLQAVAAKFQQSNEQIESRFGICLNRELDEYQRKYKMCGETLSNDELRQLCSAFAQRLQHPLIGRCQDSFHYWASRR
jgi:hypothetical protein